MNSINFLKHLLLFASILITFPVLADYSEELEIVADIGTQTNAPTMYTTDTGSTLATISAGEIKSVFIDGVDYEGSSTRFYAYIGIPEDADEDNPVPAVVLIHGGGGTALETYVDTWVEHGYAAIMIATEGQTDDLATDEQIEAGQNVGDYYKHDAAGPARDGIYGDSDVDPITDQWMYHAASCTVLANSLIRSCPEVNEEQVGVIGVSWGGIITSTIVGIDDRFAFAIPVYGSGHLYDVDNHYGRALDDNELYINVWDPMVRMDLATMPTMWFSWPTDSIFPLDAQAKTYAASPATRMVSIKPGMGHGMGAGFNSDEPIYFANSVITGTPWCVQQSVTRLDRSVAVTFEATKVLDDASLLSTTNTGFTGDRTWNETSIALVENGDGTYTASGTIPDNTTAWLINVTSDDVIASSDFQDLEDPIDYTPSLLAYWSMSDGSGTVVSDTSGNGFDGTLSGGSWVSGRDGGALEFNGSESSDTVSIPVDVFTNVGSQISIAMWVQGDATEQPQADTVFCAEDSNGDSLFNIHLPWSDSTVYWDAGDDQISKAADTTEFEDQWNHWVFTKDADSGEMNIYLNGELWLAGTGKSGSISNDVSAACFGSGVDENYYEGSMDEVRIYNTILSDSEILLLAISRPVADAASISVTEDESIDFTLTGWSADGSNVTYVTATQPTNGILSGTAPDLTYTPDADFYGTDQFYFYVNDGAENSLAAAVSITTTGTQDAPEADTQSIITYQNESIDLVLSGTDIDGDSLSYEVVSDPANGTLSGTAPDLTYTPSTDYAGDDSFTFKVTDGSDDSEPATVSIWVAEEVSEVIAAYDFDDGSGETTTSVTLQDDNVVASDYSVGSGLTEVIDTSSSSLSEDFDAENNIFGTTNAISFGGDRDDLGFTRAGSLANAISEDEYLTFTVTPNDSTTINLSRLTFRARIESSLESADYWALCSSVDGFLEANVITNGLTSTAEEWVGHVLDLSDSSFQNIDEEVEFRLYIYNGRNLKSSSTLFDKVILHGTTTNEDEEDSNSAPVADSASITTWEDTSVDITLTGSDSDGDSLTYDVVDSPTNGTLSGTAPDLSYTPTSGYTGTDSFTFTVSDSEYTSASATVTIQINDTESSIAWNTEENISNTSDISTNGTSVWAYSFGSSGSYEVNGVTFTGEDSPSGNTDVTTDLTDSYTGYGNSDGTFSTLAADYQSILESGAYGSGDSTTITLSGLSTGNEYEVQFWLNDSRNRSDMDSKPRSATLSDGSIVLDYNTTGANTDDGLGQSITGMFTADASTMDIELATVVPQLNAIQLREVSDSVSASESGSEAIGELSCVTLSGGTNIAFSWTASSGAIYAVEATTNLVSGPWLDITNGVISQNDQINITNDITGEQQFFRIYLEE